MESTESRDTSKSEDTTERRDTTDSWDSIESSHATESRVTPFVTVAVGNGSLLGLCFIKGDAFITVKLAAQRSK